MPLPAPNLLASSMRRRVPSIAERINKMKPSRVSSPSSPASLCLKMLVNRCSVAGFLGSTFLVTIVYLFGRGAGAPAQTPSVVSAKVDSGGPGPSGEILRTEISVLALRPKRTQLEGLDVIYQFPQESCLDMKGLLFLYHGCHRSSASFFYSPQGRDMMLMALESGFAVVAFEKPHACWGGGDLKPAIKMGFGWIEDYLLPHCEKEGLDSAAVSKLDRFGFGASSGGSFVAQIAETELNLLATNVQIMAPRASITKPTIFTVMSKDPFTMQGVEKISSDLAKEGVPTEVLATNAKAMTPDYLTSRFSEMTKDTAAELCADLAQNRIIDKAGGDLALNPRSKQSVLDALFDKYSSASTSGFGVREGVLEILTSAELKDAKTLWLIEELNVCYDQHEITAEYFDRVLDFFVKNSGHQADSSEEAES